MMTHWTADTIQDGLSPRPARYYDTVGSTNDAALDWLRAGAPEGAVVLADEQTQGRGRLGRSWFAPPGTALMLSYVLQPDAQHVGRATMLGAVSICETLEAFGAADIGLKWPNDARLNGRKVCGVLPEAAWDGNRLRGVVLGIGLNVSVDFQGTPMEATATGVETALGRPIDRLDLLKHLLTRLDDWARQMGTDALFAAWRSRLTMLGQPVSVTSGGETVRGTAEAVDPSGALLVRTREGTLRRVIAGDLALGEQDQAHGD